MSNGPRLTQGEIDEALALRAAGHNWRSIGAILNRDPSGLCRACDHAEPPNANYRNRRRVRRDHGLPINSPLHPRNSAMTG